MTDEIKVDDLETVAKPLAEGASGYAGLSPPQLPDAGFATLAVAKFLESLGSTMGELVTTVARTADAVQINGANYETAEQHNTAHISSVERQLPQGGPR